jgi:hypothetical protein
LRCDDAARDARVNREVCRQMGIASVVVMPVVNDDEVLGVFELFSGKANAFGVRDVSAVQRLSEMVETAVRLAQATERLPEQLKMQEASVSDVDEVEVLEEQVVDGQALDGQALDGQDLEGQVLEDVILDPVLDERKPVLKVAAEENREAATPDPLKAEAQAPEVPAPAAEAAPSKKPLFWSAALNPTADAAQPEEADQSHVPPVLRSLRKCDACGFPISAGRVLCVECEEKKWRGQLGGQVKVPKAAPRQTAANAPVVPTAPTSKPEVRAFAAAAQSVAANAPLPTGQRLSAPVLASTAIASPAVKESTVSAVKPIAVPPVPSVSVPEKVVEPAPQKSQAPVPEFVLSAGLAPSQSWLARNKYVLGVLLAVGIAAVAVFLLR